MKNLHAVFQLGIFLRALCPVHTVLRPARFTLRTARFTQGPARNKLLHFLSFNFVCIFFWYIYQTNCCFLCFHSHVKMLVKCLQICAYVFIDRPQNDAQTSFHSRAGLWPNYGCSHVNLVIHALNCARFCVVCVLNLLCQHFGRSRAGLCPIYFSPGALFPT